MGEQTLGYKLHEEKDYLYNLKGFLYIFNSNEKSGTITVGKPDR